MVDKNRRKMKKNNNKFRIANKIKKNKAARFYICKTKFKY